jgi:hypothetical protein
VSEPPANIGLARLPSGVQSALEHAADNVVAAATTLEQLTDRRRPELFEELERHARRGELIADELRRLLRNSRLGDDERAHLLRLGRAILEVVEAIVEAGHCGLSCECGGDAQLLAGVLRDTVRGEAELIRAMTGGQEPAGLDHLRALRSEARTRMRSALTHALEGTDPLDALRREHCLELFDHAMGAGRRVEFAVERVALERM